MNSPVTSLLHISVSARGKDSISRGVARKLITALQAIDPTLRIVERNLGVEPVPHITGDFATASLMPAVERSEAERVALALSETLIAELEAADVLVISTPMHNFTVPSVLKGWLDHVIRPGRTFRGTAIGKTGLLADRPTFAIVACGGGFGEDAGAQTDFLSPYLRYAFEMIGLFSLEILRLNELNRGSEKFEKSLQQADFWIGRHLRGLSLVSAESGESDTDVETWRDI